MIPAVMTDRIDFVVALTMARSTHRKLAPFRITDRPGFVVPEPDA